MAGYAAFGPGNTSTTLSNPSSDFDIEKWRSAVSAITAAIGPKMRIRFPGSSRRITPRMRIELPEPMRKYNTRMNKIDSDMFKFFNMTALRHGMTEREGQIDMAETVLDSIKNKKHLLEEAGVGIGKSYGYLVPALLYHKVTNAPVVIATSTIALQEQLAADMARLLPMLGMKDGFIVAKGQGNYLCSKKVHNLAIKGTEEEGIPEILDELRKGHVDRRDLKMEVPEKLWNKVCISGYSRKSCSSCTFASECVYHQMRERVVNAGIVICNQSLLTVHLLHMKQGWPPLLNPKMEIVIVDEAHNLEGNVRLSQTKSVSKKQLERLVINANNTLGSRAEGLIDDWIINDFESGIHDFFGNLEHQVAEQIREETQRSGRNIRQLKSLTNGATDRFFFEDLNGAYDLLDELIRTVRVISAAFWEEEASHGRKSETNAIGELKRFSEELGEMILNKSCYTFWIQIERGNYQLCYCPKDTAGMIKDLYFGKDKVTIMTSATMTGTANGTNEERYAYFIRNTGFPTAKDSQGRMLSGRLAYPAESPFNYDEHAMIYHADDLPHPTKEHEAFIREGTKRLKEILDISEGRALVLFTSKEDMREVAAELKKQGTSYKVLVQKGGSSQAEILKEFKEDEHAVLLGTGAYWEGISIEGRTLSNVVIFRLPFPVPDPISTEKEKGCENPLMEVRVPDMVIKLKQGVGRLIRNETDKGIISILDCRLSDTSTAPYKDIVWNALPIRNRTNSIQEIKEFYENTVIEANTDMETQEAVNE